MSGVVAKVLDSAETAFVRLESGGLVTIPGALLPTGVRIEQALVEGMRVSGILVDGCLHVLMQPLEAGALTDRFPSGSVTLALVTRVTADSAYLALHPDVPVLVSRRDVSSNPLDRLDGLLTVGDAVRVRVLHHTDGTLRFRLLDVDDDEPVLPPLALLPGGPEWLRLPAAEQEGVGAQESAEELAAGLPAVSVVDDVPDGRRALQTAQLTIAAKQAQIDALERELSGARDASAAEADTLREEMQRLRAQLRDERAAVSDLRRQLRDVRRAISDARPERPRDRRTRFLDEVEWLRHELLLAWIARYEPADRRTWRLPDDFVIGSRMLQSLEQLSDDSLDKALKAAVDVLTGRAKEIPGRELHPLRTSVVGNSADLVRDDGARCMRCAIEQGAPSARRLHYWVRRDGLIELSRVVLHDDMEP